VRRKMGGTAKQVVPYDPRRLGRGRVALVLKHSRPNQQDSNLHSLFGRATQSQRADGRRKVLKSRLELAACAEKWVARPSKSYRTTRAGLAVGA
jgi:hypothetical protein